MRIHDIDIDDVAAGRNWRVKEDGDIPANMTEWEIEDCPTFKVTDSVVYSGLAVLETGEVRPLLLVREVGTDEWWGDTCVYVHGKWGELRQTDNSTTECFIAEPLSQDPSFVGEYAHERQRAGFARWRDYLSSTT